MYVSILNTIKKLKKDRELKNYHIENKGDWKKSGAKYNDAIADIAAIHAKYKSDINKIKDLKRMGLKPKDRKEVMQSLKGRSMTAKDIQERFKLTEKEAAKIFEKTKGEFLKDKKALRAVEKKIKNRERMNIWSTVHAREEEDASMAQSLADKREKGSDSSMTSFESENSSRLGVSGMTYSTGIGTKKLSTQDLRGSGSVNAGSSYGVSASGAAKSGGVLNQGKGAASIAGGFGAKKIPSSGSGGGSVPLGF